MKGKDRAAEALRVMQWKELQALGNCRTPYGTLVQPLEVPLQHGRQLDLIYMNPFALCYYVALLSPQAFEFYKHYLSQELQRMFLHCDDFASHCHTKKRHGKLGKLFFPGAFS